jgi:hypothetical protein
MQNSKMPPMTSKVCVDEATEAALTNMGQGTMRQTCPKHDVHVAGSNATIDSVCKFGPYTQTAHTAIAFAGNSSYRSETHTHMQPPMPNAGGDHVSTIDARWSGPCPADMKPGDVVMGNGMRMNMRAMGGMHMGPPGH